MRPKMRRPALDARARTWPILRRRLQPMRIGTCQIKTHISNNVGPVKPFLSTLLSFHLKEFFSFVLFRFLCSCIDNHGSFVISRPVSVRPKHLFDPYFDHDYSFKLPWQGAGCPIRFTAFYFAPCGVTSCPAYEPNSNDCEYSQPFRHIQYNRIASLRPIATLAMLLCRRIAR